MAEIKFSLLSVLTIISNVVNSVAGLLEPTFESTSGHVTVVSGQHALLPCSIDNIGKFKVVWLDVNAIPLTYDDRRVIDDTRFSIVRSDDVDWNLHIKDTRREDNGQYRCTVNTSPVKSKVVSLLVKVPAQIIDEASSKDITVREGDTFKLYCNVTGVPHPEVTWIRKSLGLIPSTMVGRSDYDRSDPICEIGTADEEFSATGEVLTINNISRYCDDVYECTASNEVPPSVNRQIRVTVEFAPEIKTTTKRIAQSRGRETILECVVIAFPHAVSYWQKNGLRIKNSLKYRIEAYDEGYHTLTLSLRIFITESGDYGEYQCVAANSLGSDEGVVNLYEFEQKITEDHSKGRGGGGGGGAVMVVELTSSQSTSTSTVPSPWTLRHGLTIKQQPTETIISTNKKHKPGKGLSYGKSSSASIFAGNSSSQPSQQMSLLAISVLLIAGECSIARRLRIIMV